MSLAKLNPLRYRGYYYDNETGYYYLQSRYYDPELGRFISADGFEYLDTSNRLNANAYIYCWNCPTAFEDAEGTTPKLSIDKQTILNFLSNIGNSMKDGIETGIKELKNSITSGFQNLQSQYSASIEKLKFYYMNPGELTSEILSNLLGKEVHIEFKLLKEIRSRIVSAFQTIKQGIDNIRNKDDNEEVGIEAFSTNSNKNSENNNAALVVIQSIIAAIELDWINDFLEFFGLGLEKLFKGVSDFAKETASIFLTTLNVLFGYIPNYIRGGAVGSSTTLTLDKMFEVYAKDNGVKKDVGVVRAFGAIFSLIGFSVDMDSAGEGLIFTKTEDIIMNVVGLVIDLFSLFLGPAAGILVPIASDIVMDVTALRIKGFIIMC